jgi:hypothetical protein
LLGWCEWNGKRIYVHVAAHNTDRSVRETLLHEMAHVGAGPGVRVAHGYKFLAQMEHLLRARAPVSFGNPEMPDVGFVALAVPRRFPLCRAAAQRLQKRNERAIPKNLPDHVITDEEILSNFEDAACDGLSWNQAKMAVGQEQGLLDVEGRPVNARARRLLARARPSFRRAVF